jgi:hypothetical protein
MFAVLNVDAIVRSSCTSQYHSPGLRENATRHHGIEYSKVFNR